MDLLVVDTRLDVLISIFTFDSVVRPQSVLVVFYHGPSPRFPIRYTVVFITVLGTLHGNSL